MDKQELKELQSFSETIAKGAGQILLNYRERAVIKARKSDYLDIATSADIASEEYLIRAIQNKYPKHNIISEETGDKKIKSDFTWIIDPLDGTKEYIRHIPIFNVSLTVEYKNKVIVGTVFHPCTKELYSSSLGNGCFLNGRELNVSSEKELSKSMVWIHLPHFKNTEKERQLTWRVAQELARKVYRLRAFQADVTVLAWLALGALEGFVMTISGPKWWDVAPGILMVEEAGGKVTTLDNKPINSGNFHHGIIASNGKIHDQLLKIVNS